MRTLIDDVFDELIDDLNKWHKKYTNDSDIRVGLHGLRDLLEDYEVSTEEEIRELEQDKSWEQADREYDEWRIREYEKNN